jgi:hypothetical protein
MSTLDFGTYMCVLMRIPYLAVSWACSYIYQNPVILVVKHKHTGFWYKYGRAYKHTLIGCLISTLIYIPKSCDTGCAHEHTGFWYIYGRTYEDTLIGCLMSTLIYIPNSCDTGCAHEHTGFWYIYGRAYEDTLIGCLISIYFRLPMACLWDTLYWDSHKHAQYMHLHSGICSRTCLWPNCIIFGRLSACLWDTLYRDSHKHAQYMYQHSVICSWLCLWPNRIIFVCLWRAYEIPYIGIHISTPSICTNIL